MKKFNRNLFALFTAGVVATVPSYASYAYSQDETVYVKLQSTGEVQNISVTEHLINDDKKQELIDHSFLKDIENLNGFETFTIENNSVKWNAAGKDIYYSGTTDQKLPIELNISYRLDGVEKTLDDIIGKSGKVEIRLYYKNLSKVGNLYTPFVAAVATTLDESKVSNVHVTNGKATSNGRTIAIAAVAAPGLYESLGLDELKNSDEVVISFETEKFELGEIYTIITPKILDSADLSTFSELDDLYAKVGLLSQSSNKLVKGTQNLKLGIDELRAAVLAAKQQVTVPEMMLGEETISRIANAAASAAAQQVEAQRATISAGVKQQVEGNEILMNALKLQAAAMCQAQAGMVCPEANVNSILTQLVEATESAMIENSMILARTTAQQTAATTAREVALQISSAVQSEVGPALSGALDMMIGGINQLAKGANDLSAGMAQFDREGIQPLTNFVNGKVRVTTTRLNQLTKLADDYNNYAGLADDVQGTTKFIMMVEGRK